MGFLKQTSVLLIGSLWSSISAAQSTSGLSESQATLPSVSFAFDYTKNSSADSAVDSQEDSIESEFYVDDKPVDFVFVNGDDDSDAWFEGYSATDDPDGFTEGAGRLMYQSADWVLIENGAQHEMLESSWARFRTSNTAASALSICAMLVNWDADAWSGSGNLALIAEIEARLQDQCDVNDTIALSFTEPVSSAVAAYLESGETGGSQASPLRLSAINSAATSMDNRVFIQLTSGQCLKSVSQSQEILQVRLDGGLSCPYTKSNVSSSDGESSDDNSGWAHDLKFIIPISCCVFLLGCASLWFVLRNKKNATPPSETPKEEEKEVTATLPYVLTLHSIV